MNATSKKNRRGLKVALFALVLTLALAAVVLIQKIRIQKEYIRQLNLGEKYFEELDYENAEICFQKAIEINNQKINPYIALCNTYTELENYKKAYEVVGIIEEQDTHYNAGVNQKVVDELTRNIDKHKSALEDAKWKRAEEVENNKEKKTDEEAGEAGSIAVIDDEIHQLLVAHYANTGVTVMTGTSEGNIYYCDVRGGVPGNPNASQRIYGLTLNKTTGEVVEENVITNTVSTYSLW